MVASYEIKRNALSARWGVWSSEEGADSAVGNLLAEFKSQDQAEMFKERVAAGQAPESVIAEITAKPASEKSEGGLFGKFFKRGGKADAVTAPQTNNPVIQIQAASAKSEVEDTQAIAEDMTPEMAAEPEVPRKPMIRYEDPAPPERPAIMETAPVMSEPEQPVMTESETEPEPVSASEPEMAPVASVSEVSQMPIAEAPAQPESAVEAPAMAAEEEAPDHKSVRMISRVKARDIAAPEDQMQEFSPAPAEPQTQAEAEESKRQGMVNWTFTPPPDVSAEEVQAGAAPAAPAQAPAPQSQAPAMEVREVHGTKIAVETARFEALKSEAAGGELISDKKYNSIASKEYTEVSKAYASGNSQGTLHDELLHLSAVCMAWADAIEKRMASGANTKVA